MFRRRHMHSSECCHNVLYSGLLSPGSSVGGMYIDDSFFPDTFVPSRYFRINNCPLVRMWKSVPTLFVQTSEISRLSEPGLTNHHCSNVAIRIWLAACISPACFALWARYMLHFLPEHVIC